MVPNLNIYNIVQCAMIFTLIVILLIQRIQLFWTPDIQHHKIFFPLEHFINLKLGKTQELVTLDIDLVTLGQEGDKSQGESFISNYPNKINLKCCTQRLSTSSFTLFH